MGCDVHGRVTFNACLIPNFLGILDAYFVRNIIPFLIVCTRIGSNKNFSIVVESGGKM
jgi:hypothetical protein